MTVESSIKSLQTTLSGHAELHGLIECIKDYTQNGQWLDAYYHTGILHGKAEDQLCPTLVEDISSLATGCRSEAYLVQKAGPCDRCKYRSDFDMGM